MYRGEDVNPELGTDSPFSHPSTDTGVDPVPELLQEPGHKHRRAGSLCPDFISFFINDTGIAAS